MKCTGVQEFWEKTLGVPIIGAHNVMKKRSASLVIGCLIGPAFGCNQHTLTMIVLAGITRLLAVSWR